MHIYISKNLGQGKSNAFDLIHILHNVSVRTDVCADVGGCDSGCVDKSATNRTRTPLAVFATEAICLSFRSAKFLGICCDKAT